MSIQHFLEFLDQSPTAFHAIDNAKHILQKNGFKEIKEEDAWSLQPQTGYFVIRNGSSICAFRTPSAKPERVRILASHSDSPALKLKPKAEYRKHHMIMLGVEVYGAPLLSSWLNRDLGIAGRILYTDKSGNIQENLIKIDEAPVTIPQLAIHLDREVNEKGLTLNKQEHLNALAALDLNNSLPPGQSYLEKLLRAKVQFEALLGFDLFLYPLEPARLIGFEKQMMASYRIDNLASFYASLQAITADKMAEHDIQMIACWDNEEIGSNTSQGAASPFISQILERILLTYEMGREAFFQFINRSFCVSIDLSHAVHPNYTEKHDAQHQPMLGHGVVLKSNAQFRYASDARSSAHLQALCLKRNLPLQRFATRGDMPCGTTIGPIHASATGMLTVDIGCPQLSMHSCRELMACQDYLHLVDLLKAVLK